MPVPEGEITTSEILSTDEPEQTELEIEDDK